MKYYTSYNIILNTPIYNFDNDLVDSEFINYEKFIDINYMRFQYNNPYIIYVSIKNGKEDILKIAYLIYELYKIPLIIKIMDTNYNLFYNWKDIHNYKIPI